MKRVRRNFDLLAVALFMATVGLGAPVFLWAVTQIGTNQIKNQAITNAKVAPGISAEKIGVDTSISDTEYGYLNGVTGPIQAQINNIPEGAKGDTGAAGQNGNDGAKGDTGPQGLQGADGAKGDTGPSGANGLDGAKGDTGPQGPAGGGSGGGIAGSGTPGRLAEWTGSDTVGSSTDSDTDIHNAVINSPTSAQKVLWDATGADSANKITGSLTTGKIPMATGTKTIGDTTFTDTQNRTRHLRFAILGASTAADTTICLIPKLASSITVTNLEVICNVDPATEITGDILFCDTSFIAKGSPTVINDFDTTAGLRSDSTITSAAVASGKCIYLKFDVTPIVDLKSIAFDLTYLIN